HVIMTRSNGWPCRAIVTFTATFALVHSAFGQGLPSTSALLEKFEKLSPTARLDLINTANSEHDFKAAFRGDLVQAIIERGTLEAVDVSEVFCRLRARDPKSAVASTIKWLAADGAFVKKGQRVLELDDSALREQLAEQTLKRDQTEAA